MDTFSPIERNDVGRKQANDSAEGIHLCSSESLSSTNFPWKLVPSRRHFVVSRNETGREVQPSSFYLCFLSVLLFCGGILMCGGCIWSMLYRIPYTYIFNKSVIIDASNFSLVGGLICFPCSWIAWTSHDSRRSYIHLRLLILLLCFSITMLTTGAVLGLINRLKISFEDKVHPPKLEHTPYLTMLNETLLITMVYYGDTFNYKYSWDKMQRRLRCCGVHGPADWNAVDKTIPQSCYNNSINISTTQLLYQEGCINAVAYDIAWQMCLMTGFALIVLGIQGATILLTSFLYITEKKKRSRPQVELVMMSN